MPNSRGGWLQEPAWEKFTLWAEAGEAPPLHLGNKVTLLMSAELCRAPPRLAGHCSPPWLEGLGDKPLQ